MFLDVGRKLVCFGTRNVILGLGSVNQHFFKKKFHEPKSPLLQCIIDMMCMVVGTSYYTLVISMIWMDHVLSLYPYIKTSQWADGQKVFFAF